jgi:hypothetical protein
MMERELTYNEWLKTEDGQNASTAILASSANMYPDIFELNRQLRLAYEDYLKNTSRDKK